MSNKTAVPTCCSTCPTTPHHPQERLANALALEVGVTGRPLSQLKKSEKEQLLTALTAWQLPVQVCVAGSRGVKAVRMRCYWQHVCSTAAA